VGTILNTAVESRPAVEDPLVGVGQRSLYPVCWWIWSNLAAYNAPPHPPPSPPHPESNPRSWRFRRADVRRLAEANGTMQRADAEFLERMAFRSGLGDATAVVPAIQACPNEKPGIEVARGEYEATCFSCVAELFEKTGVKPAQIRFVITNSSLFNPTPSLSAALMNRFKMRDDTINYSLGGMGCSGESGFCSGALCAC
jgi:hypothetical protein